MEALGLLQKAIHIMKVLILALAMVESSFNPSAVGDNGDAVGLLQIHECVIQDVNRVYGTSYTLDDRLNPQASVAICTCLLYTSDAADE